MEDITPIQQTLVNYTWKILTYLIIITFAISELQLQLHVELWQSITITFKRSQL